jgi:hypothetical protein
MTNVVPFKSRITRTMPAGAAVVTGSTPLARWAWDRVSEFGTFDDMRERLPDLLLENAGAVPSPSEELNLVVVGYSESEGKVMAFRLSSPAYAAEPLGVRRREGERPC